MATAEATTLSKLQAAYDARLDGGCVDRYVVEGTDISMCPLDKLEAMLDKYRWLVRNQSTSPMRLGRTVW